MKVSCTSCQAGLNIDEKKIPPGGARIKCPTCGNVFPVKPGAAAVPLPGAGGPPPIPGATRAAAPPSNVKVSAPGPKVSSAVPLPGGAAANPFEDEATRAMPTADALRAAAASNPFADGPTQGAIPLPGQAFAGSSKSGQYTSQPSGAVPLPGSAGSGFEAPSPFGDSGPSETVDFEAFPSAAAETTAPFDSAPAQTVTDDGFGFSPPPPAPTAGGFDFAPPPAAAGGFDFAPPPAADPGATAGGFDFAPPPPEPAAGGFDFAPPPAADPGATAGGFDFAPPPPEPAAGAFDFAPPPAADPAPAAGGFDFAPPPPAPAAGGFDFAPPPAADPAPAAGAFDFAPPPPAPAAGGFDFAPPPAADPAPAAGGFDFAPPPPAPAAGGFDFAPAPPAAPPALDFAEPVPPPAAANPFAADADLEFDPLATGPAPQPAADLFEADLSKPKPGAAPAASGPADGLEMLSFIDEGAAAAKSPFAAPTLGAAAGGAVRRFHIRRRSGKVFGPFEDSVILKMLESGQLLGNEEISTDTEAWQPIGQEPVFQTAIAKLMESPTRTETQTVAAVDDKPKGPSMEKLKELYEGRMAAVAVAQTRAPIEIRKYLPFIIGGSAVLLLLIVGIVINATTPYGFFALKLMFPAKVKADTREFGYLEEARASILKDTYKSYKDAQASTEQALAVKEYPEARALWNQAVYYLARRYHQPGNVAQAVEATESIKLLGQKHVEVLKALAGQALNEKRADDALQFISEALAREDNQNDLELTFLRAEAYLQKNQTPQAKAEFEQALKKNAKSAKALHALGLIHRSMKEFEPAVEKFKAALAADPEHGASAIELAALMTEKGQAAEASKAVDEALTEANRKKLAPAEVAQALALRGTALLTDDKKTEAIAAFEEALKIDATNPIVQSRLGKAYLDMHEPEKALPFLKGAAEARTDSLADTQRYLDALLQLSKLDEATKVMGAASARFPGNADIAFLSAQVSDALDKTNDAIEGYRKAIAAAPENGDAYLRLARLFIRMRRYNDARPEIEKGLEKAPENTGLRVGLAELLLRERNLDGAEKEFKAALAANPRIAEAYLGQSILAFERKQYEVAGEQIDKALEINPRIAGGHLQKGRALWRLGKLDESVKELETAKELEPFNMEVVVTLGAVKFERKDYTGAEVHLGAALTKEPGNPDANYYLARLKNARSEHTGAQEVMKRAIDFDGKNPLYHYWMGRIAADLQHVPEAMEEWRLALTLNPTYADALESMGRVHFERNEFKVAIENFEKTLATDATRNELRLLIGDAQMKLESWDNAIRSYTEALEANPELKGAEVKIGSAWQEKHAYPKAIEWYRKAVEKDDANAEAWQGLGLMYQELKKKKDAVAAYKKYLEVKPTAEDRKEIEDRIYSLTQE